MRTLSAFAEAMAPGGHGLPAAEHEVDVATPVARFLAGLPPRTLARMRLGLRVFERLPFPWRFSRMSAAARAEYLAEMELSRSALHRDLFLLLKTLTLVGYVRDERVAGGVGVKARCAVDGDQPAAPGSLGDLTPPLEDESCDVVIVGSGAGGAVAASVLAEAGLDVVVLEAGPHARRDSYPDDPFEALSTLYRDSGLTVAEGRPMVPLPIGRVVGGTTLVNSGTCFRPPRPVLERWRGESGIDWATDLDGELDGAEEFLRVTPVDVERMGRNGQLCMEGAEALGASHGPIRRNAGRCVQCSSCPNGCPIDAKQAMHVSYLPRAVAAGARVRANVEARRVLVERGRAAGVECVVTEPDGRTRSVQVRAGTVICAGGALGTPELLLRSGLGGAQVGRNLRIHPAIWVGARYDEDVRGWDGVMQSYYVDEWAAHGLLMEATFTPLAFGAQWLPGAAGDHRDRLLDYARLGSIGVHLSDRSRGRVRLARDGALRTTYRLTADDARALVFGVARAAEVHFAAGAREVYPQIAGIPSIPAGGDGGLESARVRAADLRLEAFHPMGTARMGSDPAASVVDVDGEVHGLPGLHVADASVFPSSIGVNPMMTIVAFSTRIARRLAARVD